MPRPKVLIVQPQAFICPHLARWPREMRIRTPREQMRPNGNNWTPHGPGSGSLTGHSRPFGHGGAGTDQELRSGTMPASETDGVEAIDALVPSCRKTAARALTIVRDGVITGEGPTTKGRVHFSRE